MNAPWTLADFPTMTLPHALGSDGLPIGANEIVIVDEDGAPVGAGREGEILTRGPECFLGYRNAALNVDQRSDHGAHGVDVLVNASSKADW